MASSNVQYYEKQKELQDTMSKCEQDRFNLERELRLAMHADRTTSKMKASRLQAYWKKICDDEKRAKQRNEMLIREFERIDAHMAEMNARTQRLALMKRQYEDYISRTYPDWNNLMHGFPQKKQEHHLHHQQQQQQMSRQPKEEVDTQISSPQHIPQASRPLSPDTVHQQPPPIHQSHHGQSQYNQQSLPQGPPQIDHDARLSDHVSQSFGAAKMNEYLQESSSSVGDYENLPSARLSNEEVQSNQFIDANDHDEEISQPIKSVEIQSKTSGRMVQAPQYAMVPDEDIDEEDETSEFATDNDIPMAQSMGNTQVLVDQPKIQDKVKSSGPIRPELSIDGLINLLNMVESDMQDAFSLEGYYRSSWPDTARKNDIIRHSNAGQSLGTVDVNLVSMVILEQITLIVRSLAEKCVLPENLLHGDVSSLSAEKLRQHLSPEAQIIWDSLFRHFQELVKHQAMEPHELSAIFTPCLVREGGSQDKGHFFMVKLLEECNSEAHGVPKSPKSPKPSMFQGSPAQTLEGSGSYFGSGEVPPLKFGSLLDSAMENPKSDDESSYIKSLPRDTTPLNETDAYKNMMSSMNNSGRSQLRRQSTGPSDTDDDVENQIATVLTQQPKPLSPKKTVEMEEPSETSSQTQTQQTTSHVYVPTAMGSMSRPMNLNSSSGQPKFQGVKISSDLDTDTEVDAGIFGGNKRTDDDFDFYD